MATKEEKDKKNKDLSDKIRLYAESESKKVFTTTEIHENGYYTTIETRDADGNGVSTRIKRTEEND